MGSSSRIGMRRWLACAALGAMLAACADLSTLSSAGDAGSYQDGLHGADAGEASTADANGPPQGDAASADGAQGVDANASDAGAPNLLQNGDFELGCAGWSAAFGSFSETTTAQQGHGACKFCMDTNWEAFFSQKVNVQVEPNQTYYAEIWVQAAASSATLDDAGLVGQELLISTPLEETSASNGPVPANWARVTSLLTTTQPSPNVTFEYRLQQTGNPAANGGVICVFLDSAVLRRL